MRIDKPISPQLINEIMRAKNCHYIILILIAFLSTTACRSKDSQAAASGGVTALSAREVKLGRSEYRKLIRTVSAPGTLAADEQATLSFKVAGRLSNLKVDLGTLVRQGQIIGRLETTEFQVRLEQAKAALQQARVRLGLPPEGDDDRIDTEKTALVRQARAVLEEAQLNRDRTIQLYNQGIQPKAELDRAESMFKVADSRYQDAIEEVRNRQAVLLQRRSELAISQQQLAETSLYAPFDGAIRERRASLGEYLASGSPVVTIVRMHPLRLRVEVPEREAQGIRVGQSAGVTIEGESGQSYSGRVARLSPAFQEQSRTLIIEAEVDNQKGRLRPGSFAKAEIHTTSTTDAVLVPASAIISFAGIQKVYTVKDGKALEKNVITGKREDDWVVVDGLEANTSVVLSPGNLVTGQPVKITH
ncbi:MAG: efflux RND transporter periplasmic adaptor subunit [Acidobacteria bacterium]|nr:efflux RND transporter periplasmic adaptor subunit [Acidobacteriota bacterium]